MLSRCVGASVVLALGLIRREAMAQVNVERLRTEVGKASTLVSLEGAFTGRTGNVDNVVVGAVASAASRLWRHRFFGSASADYARFNHETKVSKSFIHLRYNYDVSQSVAAEAYVQQQQDKFQRLLLRELAGLGPRYVLADEDELRLAVGTAYMLEYERINVPQGAPDARATLNHRWSSYLSSVWKLDERVRLLATVYVQPRLDDFGDVRVLIEAAATSDLNKRLGLKVSAMVRHDSQPPTSVLRTDVEVKNSLVVKF